MRYALISDIHGNMPALQAVLDDAQKRNIDSFIFLGDYSVSLNYPNEVLNAILSINSKFIISGNHEEFLKEIVTQDENIWRRGQFNIAYWHFRELTGSNKDFLTQLPTELKIKDDYSDIYLFHSAKRFFKNTLLGDMNSKHYSIRADKYSYIEYTKEYKKRLLQDYRLKTVLSELPDGVYAYGHNHMQMHLIMDGKLMINPGSCGVPLDMANYAPYSVLDTSKGEMSVEEYRVAYDIEMLLKEYRNSELYDYAKVFCGIIDIHLTKGREYMSSFLEYLNDYADQIDDNIRPFSQKTWETGYDLWKTESGL